MMCKKITFITDNKKPLVAYINLRSVFDTPGFQGGNIPIKIGKAVYRYRYIYNGFCLYMHNGSASHMLYIASGIPQYFI